MARGRRRRTSGLDTRDQREPLTWYFVVERVTGIEPALSAWEAGDVPWPGTLVIGSDQEIQPLQLHLAACLGRKIG